MSQEQQIQQNVEQINSLIGKGEALSAFDQFYADDVSMQENSQPPTVGKQANRSREEEFLGKITAFRGFKVNRVLVSGDTAVIEADYDYSHADWGDVKQTQVGIQQWRDGKIVSERFFYGQ